jgi:hypothetical protein
VWVRRGGTSSLIFSKSSISMNQTLRFKAIPQNPNLLKTKTIMKPLKSKRKKRENFSSIDKLENKNKP